MSGQLSPFVPGIALLTSKRRKGARGESILQDLFPPSPPTFSVSHSFVVKTSQPSKEGLLGSSAVVGIKQEYV